MTFSQSPWKLSDLFPASDAPQLQAAFDELQKQVAEFEQYRSDLKPGLDAEHFMEILEHSEKTNRLASRVYGFAGLMFAADTQNQAAMALIGRVQQFFAEIQNRTLFFSLWWKDLDDANARRLLDVSGDYRYYLEALRLQKPHTLSEPEEKIVNLKNVTGAEAMTTLYDSITNRYLFKLEIDGETREMTRGELMSCARSADPDLRARAYQELYRVYGDDGPILGQMYQTLVRDWGNENVRLRKHAKPIAARNLHNDIPDEAVEALLSVAQKNAGVFQRFFKIKARLLGIPSGKLRRYDVYAPVSESSKEYPFEKAAQMVLESFSEFHPDFGKKAQRVFDDNHLDSEVRKGKRGGAFCWTVEPALTPWVLVNYQGKGDDVATLAHELGHAIHSMMAESHSVFTQSSCLPLAETASTFGEMMLIDRLMAEEKDPAVRRDMLFRQIDDNYATIMRQSFFALFEKEAHEMVQNNASVDELAAAYLENLKTQFGDSVEVSDEFKWEWVSIPHIFHTPFYVYAYAFGQLLVLALYKQFKTEGESFKPRYMKLLAAGGSEAPEKILQESGIDIRSAAFWQGGFDVLNGLVDELEKL
ncbi:MAG: M3 family oligoendopeptidase [Anaerolineales bacterium]|jgi:oligoendopeptidase F|nr:M3 family oligoendopeptidase [Anaerolineales bacterium]